MKAKRQFITMLLSVLAACIVFLQAVLPAFAAGDGAHGWHIYDFADILTDDEEDVLNTRVEEILDTYGCEIFIVVVEDYTEYGNDIFDVADQTYQYNDLGAGEDHNGVLLYISMEDRDYATYFYGPVVDYAFDRYGQAQMEKPFLQFLRENNWYGGFSQFLDTCDEYLADAASGHPVRRSPVPTLLLFLGISCLISIIICEILRRKSISVKKAEKAGSYISEPLQLISKWDTFLYVTETRELIERGSGSSSGSTSHTSASGGSGRSGKF